MMGCSSRRTRRRRGGGLVPDVVTKYITKKRVKGTQRYNPHTLSKWSEYGAATEERPDGSLRFTPMQTATLMATSGLIGTAGTEAMATWGAGALASAGKWIGAKAAVPAGAATFSTIGVPLLFAGMGLYMALGGAKALAGFSTRVPKDSMQTMYLLSLMQFGMKSMPTHKLLDIISQLSFVCGPDTSGLRLGEEEAQQAAAVLPTYLPGTPMAAMGMPMAAMGRPMPEMEAQTAENEEAGANKAVDEVDQMLQRERLHQRLNFRCVPHVWDGRRKLWVPETVYWLRARHQLPSDGKTSDDRWQLAKLVMHTLRLSPKMSLNAAKLQVQAEKSGSKTKRKQQKRTGVSVYWEQTGLVADDVTQEDSLLPSRLNKEDRYDGVFWWRNAQLYERNSDSWLPAMDKRAPLSDALATTRVLLDLLNCLGYEFAPWRDPANNEGPFVHEGGEGGAKKHFFAHLQPCNLYTHYDSAEPPIPRLRLTVHDMPEVDSGDPQGVDFESLQITARSGGDDIVVWSAGGDQQGYEEHRWMNEKPAITEYFTKALFHARDSLGFPRQDIRDALGGDRGDGLMADVQNAHDTTYNGGANAIYAVQEAPSGINLCRRFILQHMNVRLENKQGNLRAAKDKLYLGTKEGQHYLKETLMTEVLAMHLRDSMLAFRTLLQYAVEVQLSAEAPATRIETPADVAANSKPVLARYRELYFEPSCRRYRAAGRVGEATTNVTVNENGVVNLTAAVEKLRQEVDNGEWSSAVQPLRIYCHDYRREETKGQLTECELDAFSKYYGDLNAVPFLRAFTAINRETGKTVEVKVSDNVCVPVLADVPNRVVDVDYFIDNEVVGVDEEATKNGKRLAIQANRLKVVDTRITFEIGRHSIGVDNLAVHRITAEQSKDPVEQRYITGTMQENRLVVDAQNGAFTAGAIQSAGPYRLEVPPNIDAHLVRALLTTAWGVALPNAAGVMQAYSVVMSKPLLFHSQALVQIELVSNNPFIDRLVFDTDSSETTKRTESEDYTDRSNWTTAKPLVLPTVAPNAGSHTTMLQKTLAGGFELVQHEWAVATTPTAEARNNEEGARQADAKWRRAHIQARLTAAAHAAAAEAHQNASQAASTADRTRFNQERQAQRDAVANLTSLAAISTATASGELKTIEIQLRNLLYAKNEIYNDAFPSDDAFPLPASRMTLVEARLATWIHEWQEDRATPFVAYLKGRLDAEIDAKFPNTKLLSSSKSRFVTARNQKAETQLAKLSKLSEAAVKKSAWKAFFDKTPILKAKISDMKDVGADVEAVVYAHRYINAYMAGEITTCHECGARLEHDVADILADRTCLDPKKHRVDPTHAVILTNDISKVLVAQQAALLTAEVLSKSQIAVVAAQTAVSYAVSSGELAKIEIQLRNYMYTADTEYFPITKLESALCTIGADRTKIYDPSPRRPSHSKEDDTIRQHNQWLESLKASSAVIKIRFPTIDKIRFPTIDKCKFTTTNDGAGSKLHVVSNRCRQQLVKHTLQEWVHTWTTETTDTSSNELIPFLNKQLMQRYTSRYRSRNPKQQFIDDRNRKAMQAIQTISGEDPSKKSAWEVIRSVLQKTNNLFPGLTPESLKRIDTDVEAMVYAIAYIDCYSNRKITHCPTCGIKIKTDPKSNTDDTDSHCLIGHLIHPIHVVKHSDAIAKEIVKKQITRLEEVAREKATLAQETSQKIVRQAGNEGVLNNIAIQLRNLYYASDGNLENEHYAQSRDKYCKEKLTQWIAGWQERGGDLPSVLNAMFETERIAKGFKTVNDFIHTRNGKASHLLQSEAVHGLPAETLTTRLQKKAIRILKRERDDPLAGRSLTVDTVTADVEAIVYNSAYIQKYEKGNVECPHCYQSTSCDPKSSDAVCKNKKCHKQIHPSVIAVLEPTTLKDFTEKQKGVFQELERPIILTLAARLFSTPCKLQRYRRPLLLP